jgi:hypothetical protein
MADVEEDLPSRPEYMLTTVDNPHDPFTEWDEWFLWDQRAGYHTPGLLARIANSSNDLSDADQHMAIQVAIDEIVRENVLGVHRKVKEGEVKSLIMSNGVLHDEMKEESSSRKDEGE